MQVREITFLDISRDNRMHDVFQYHADQSRCSNIFNPSSILLEGAEIFSFRGIPIDADQTEESLHSFVSVRKKNPNSIVTTNLSRLHRGVFGSPRLIDPKLFRMDGEVYATFNSGHVLSGNDIFVMKVYPKMGEVIKVVYEGRNIQERNWAFYSIGGQVFCLYGIDPVKVLKLDHATDTTWVMKDHLVKDRRDYLEGLTIGTQLSNFNDTYYFIAHKKVRRNRKKLYLGQVGMFDHEKGIVCLGRSHLAHSLESLFGEEPKWNKNLLSCTYFSGLTVDINNNLRLSYGVNDLRFGFASVIKGTV